jgi:hypothetical protein
MPKKNTTYYDVVFIKSLARTPPESVHMLAAFTHQIATSPLARRFDNVRANFLGQKLRPTGVTGVAHE